MSGYSAATQRLNQTLSGSATESRSALRTPAQRNRVTRSDTSESPILIPVEKAARLLGISRTEVYRLIGSGELDSVKIGRLRRIPVAACHEFVARRLEQADSLATR